MLAAVQVSCDRTDPHADNAFRNEIAKLNWGDGVCLVYGHKTPDSDAVCSSLAYAGLMRELGYDCEAFISSRTNNETNYISSYFGFELPEIKSSVESGTRLIVTDHEEYSQSVAGAKGPAKLRRKPTAPVSVMAYVTAKLAWAAKPMSFRR